MAILLNLVKLVLPMAKCIHTEVIVLAATNPIIVAHSALVYSTEDMKVTSNNHSMFLTKPNKTEALVLSYASS